MRGAEPVAAVVARPLFLLGPAGGMVELDGPSLLVKAGRRAPARYPLVRVSRIVSALAIQWRGYALSECISRRIPVVFLGGNGRPAGFLYPMAKEPSLGNSLIEQATACPEWNEHHRNWLRAERMRVLAEWRDARLAAGKPLSAKDFAELTRRHVYCSDPSCDTLFEPGLLHAALVALVSERVCKAGLRASYAALDGETFDLVHDVAGLLTLGLNLELCGLGSVALADCRVQLRVFQAFTERFEIRVARILGRLLRRTRDILDTWR